MRRPLLISSAIILGVSLALTGCSNKKSKDLDRYLTKVKKQKPPPIEPIPKIKNFKTHTYKAEGRRSPFKKVVSRAVTNRYAPKLGRPKEALEAYNLESLRMVGTLGKGSKTWALIRTPDGRVEKVTKGNYIGQNYGEITKITGNEVDIVEAIRGPQGWERRKTRMVLNGGALKNIVIKDK